MMWDVRSEGLASPLHRPDNVGPSKLVVYYIEQPFKVMLAWKMMFKHCYK